MVNWFKRVFKKDTFKSRELDEEQGDLSFINEDYLKAIEFYKKAIREHVELNEMIINYVKIGDCYLRLGHLTQALNHYKNAIVKSEVKQDIVIDQYIYHTYDQLSYIYRLQNELMEVAYYEEKKEEMKQRIESFGLTIVNCEMKYYDKPFMYKEELAHMLQKLGNLYQTKKDEKNAAVYYKEREELLKSDLL